MEHVLPAVLAGWRVASVMLWVQGKEGGEERLVEMLGAMHVSWACGGLRPRWGYGEQLRGRGILEN